MRTSLRMMPQAPPKSRPLSAGFTFRRAGATSRCKNHAIELCSVEKAIKASIPSPRFAGFSSHSAFVSLLSKDLVSLGRSPDEITVSRKKGVDMLLANLPQDGGGLKQLAEKVALLDSLILCLGETFGKKTDDGTRIGWVWRLLDSADKSRNEASISTQCTPRLPYPVVETGTQGTPVCIPTTARSTQCDGENAFSARFPNTSSTSAASTARDARPSFDRAIDSSNFTKHSRDNASTDIATQCSAEFLPRLSRRTESEETATQCSAASLRPLLRSNSKDIATQCSAKSWRPSLRKDSKNAGTQIVRSVSIDAETQCTVQETVINVGTQCAKPSHDSWTQMEDECKDKACVSTSVKCNQEVADATNQCNISERKALHVPSMALSKVRNALKLEKEQSEVLEKRNAALQILIEDLRAVDTARAGVLGNYRERVSELEKKVKSYQKTTTSKAVETQEATVWTHSFQHRAPLVRTFDKEVQTARRVAEDYMPTPRMELQMLAFANNFSASA